MRSKSQHLSEACTELTEVGNTDRIVSVVVEDGIITNFTSGFAKGRAETTEIRNAYRAIAIAIAIQSKDIGAPQANRVATAAFEIEGLLRAQLSAQDFEQRFVGAPSADTSEY